jgi:HAD superfamily hydrolase (TIGR01509 family)
MRELIEAGKIEARPGVHRLLDQLDAGGVPMQVATTGTRAWVEPLLDRIFGPRFQVVVTGTEVRDLKPSPAAYLEVLRRSGYPADRTVAVEDSENGVRAAVAAGLRVVAVHNDYTRDDDLSGAELIAAGFEDPPLSAWFQQRV